MSCIKTFITEYTTDLVNPLGHRKMTFNSLLLTGELTAHLAEIDRTAGERVNRMVSEMAAAQGVNEALKERDPMAWVGAMNSLKAQAEEIVLNELVYA